MSNTEVKVPTQYDVNNIIANSVTPNTIHCRNTLLFGYFQKYLLQEVFAMYKWTLPANWDEDYFKYVLFCSGFVAIANIKQFGVIPQYASLGGYNVFYRPAWAIITNPLFGTIQADIDKECTVIKLMPDYSGIMDLVNHYADQMALVSETVEVDVNNVKIATIFGAENKPQAEAYKKMFDQVASGNPAVVIGKNMLKDIDGNPAWMPFTQNVKNTYIVTDLLNDLRTIRNQFLSDIGTPNANTQKRERLITDEVNANNAETRTKCELWLESIERGIAKTKKLFGDMDFSVTYRFDAPEMNKEEKEEGAE